MFEHQGCANLDLLHRQIQEGVLIADADQAFGAFTAHACSQAAVQFYHHQLVQTVGHIVRQAAGGDLVVGLDL